MAVEMVGRDVGEDAGIGLEARHQVDLEGRQFQHIDPVPDRLAQQEHRLADIAADIDIASGRREEMAGERRRRRLAVGAGDRHQPGAAAGDLALEDFGIADDLDAGGLRLLDRPMRLRDGSAARRGSARARRAPRNRSRADRRPAGPACLRLLDRLASESSQANTSAPPSRRASAQAVPERARPKTATFLPANVRGGKHRTPTSA